MSWIVEAPNNNPSVFVLISSTVFQIDGSVRASERRNGDQVIGPRSGGRAPNLARPVACLAQGDAAGWDLALDRNGRWLVAAFGVAS
jgi:hypothetical protein